MQDAPDEMVALNTYANEFIAGVVTAKLEDSGIPAKAITSNQALIGAFGQTGWFPFTVWVRKADEERAKAVLDAVRLEQGTVDWDAVDVGEPEPGDALAKKVAQHTGEWHRPSPGSAVVIFIAGWVVCIASFAFARFASAQAQWLIRVLGGALIVWGAVLAMRVMFGAKKRQAE